MFKSMLYGVNLNGDTEYRKLKELCKIADRYNYIFVGENIKFKHSFTILPFIAENTKKAKISTGIISPFVNRCFQIKQAFRTLLEFYGNRFSVALAMGDRYGLKHLGIEAKHVINKITSCVHEIRSYKNTKEIEIFIGASSPKMIKVSSKVADGVLLNYSNPDHIKWAMRFLDSSRVKVGCYAPALILPNENKKMLKSLIFAAAVIIKGANARFLDEFKLSKLADEVRNDISKAFKYSDILLENFTMGRSLDEILDKIREYKKIGLDLCVFASPIYYNPKGMKELADALGL